MRHSLTQILATSIAAVIIVGCADQRSLETGLLPGEVHAGPTIEFVDAPVGTVIRTSDGTTLIRNSKNWLVQAPAQKPVFAINPFLWDDNRDMFGSSKLEATPAELAQLTPFIAGTNILTKTSGPNFNQGVATTIAILGVDHISVAAGDFDAVHIVRNDLSNCGNCGAQTYHNREDIWFVPGIGVVKFQALIKGGTSGAGGGVAWEAESMSLGVGRP